MNWGGAFLSWATGIRYPGFLERLMRTWCLTLPVVCLLGSQVSVHGAMPRCTGCTYGEPFAPTYPGSAFFSSHPGFRTSSLHLYSHSAESKTECRPLLAWTPNPRCGSSSAVMSELVGRSYILTLEARSGFKERLNND